MPDENGSLDAAEALDRLDEIHEQLTQEQRAVKIRRQAEWVRRLAAELNSEASVEDARGTLAAAADAIEGAADDVYPDEKGLPPLDDVE